MKKRSNGIRIALACILASATLATAQAGKWQYLPDTSDVQPREECGFAQAGGRFYLIGGREVPPVQEYQPSTRFWKTLKKPPVTINHFQAVSTAGLVYIIGAFDEGNKKYAIEAPLINVYIFDPLSDTWVKGPLIPEARRRGSAGLVEFNKKLYVVLGNRLGHTGPGAPWLDEFDPATNSWTTLPDAPRFRDHFQAAVANGKIYAIGGRQSINQVPNFTNLEKVDVYDLATKSWSTLPSPASDMQVKRSGGIVATMGNEIIYAGGSSASALYNLTDALNTVTNTWRTLAPMNRARQVTGGFVNNSGLYVVSGSGGTGGSPTLRSMEAFHLGDPTQPTGDALVSGKLSFAGTSYNFGIIQAGQTSQQQVTLTHSTGNQGVLISSLTIVGDTSFKATSVSSSAYLVRPGEPTNFAVSFTSKGTVPAETYLEIAFAIPPGTTLRVPLEANRVGSAVRGKVSSGVAAKSTRKFESVWKYKVPPSETAVEEAPSIFRNALGRTP